MKKIPILGKKWFETVEKPDGWEVIVAHQVMRPVIACGLARSTAKKLEIELNGIMRALNFKPKSHGARSRRKGHQFEREVAIALRSVFPKARRHLEYQDAEANGVDLVETGYFKFQCKKLKTYAPVSTLKEIQFDELYETPVVVTAADNEPWVAILPFADLLFLIRGSKAKILGKG